MNYSLLGFARHSFELALDAIMPRRARSIRTDALTLERVPLEPAAHDLLGVRITTLMNYQRQEVRDLIQSLKYDGASRAAHLCAGVLAEYLHEELATEKAFSQKKIVLVPLPLHASREKERGYNQIMLVLRALPEEFRDGTRATLLPAALLRVRATKPQTHFSRSERLSNVAGAFAAPDPALVQSARIYLIDDVATTGATLANAATALRRSGAAVTLIALARA
jgi:ComF family protein